MANSHVPVKLSLLVLLCLYSALPLVVGRRPLNLCSGGPRGQNCGIRCLIYDPVCGANGVTYGCGCPDADCHGVRVVKKGPCKSLPDVCGLKGRSGSGSCEIRCFRADPVCGSNGVTYWCGCPEANCKGVRVVRRGQC